MSLFRAVLFDFDFIAAFLAFAYIVGRLVQIYRDGQLRDVLGLPEVRLKFPPAYFQPGVYSANVPQSSSFKSSSFRESLDLAKP